MTDYAKPVTRLHVLTEYQCSNNGVSSRHEYLDLYPSGTKPESVDPDSLDKAVRLVVRNLFGRRVVHAEPIARPDGVGWMYGGSFVTGDSRVTEEIRRVSGEYFYGAVKLHDRQETVSQYNDNAKD